MLPLLLLSACGPGHAVSELAPKAASPEQIVLLRDAVAAEQNACINVVTRDPHGLPFASAKVWIVDTTAKTGGRFIYASDPGFQEMSARHERAAEAHSGAIRLAAIPPGAGSSFVEPGAAPQSCGTITTFYTPMIDGDMAFVTVETSNRTRLLSSGVTVFARRGGAWQVIASNHELEGPII